MPALLFDLDGTLLDTDPIHIAVFQDLMAGYGIAVDHAFYLNHVHGRLNVDVFAEFLPELADPQALSRHKEALFRDRLPRPYPEMPGATALMDRAQAEGWPIGVVTNAERANAEAMLAAIGHRDRFKTLVIGEECPRAKPHPDPYLLAMTQLGVGPEQTIVFEDSPSGIRAGAASGAFTVGIRSSLDDAGLRQHGAQATLSDFTDPTLAGILRQFQGDRP